MCARRLDELESRARRRRTKAREEAEARERTQQRPLLAELAPDDLLLAPVPRSSESPPGRAPLPLDQEWGPPLRSASAGVGSRQPTPAPAASYARAARPAPSAATAAPQEAWPVLEAASSARSMVQPGGPPPPRSDSAPAPAAADSSSWSRIARGPEGASSTGEPASAEGAGKKKASKTVLLSTSSFRRY